MKKGGILLITVFLLSAGLLRTANAQNIEPNIVRGSTYNCFFVTALDVFNSQLNFSEDIGLAFTSFNGEGIYLAVGNLFSGTYFSVDESIGGKTGDISIFIMGSNVDPFIFGSGILTMDYVNSFGMIFFGIKV